MTNEQRKQFDLLIDALWGGEISEARFMDVCLELGADLGRINQVIDEIKLEDGTFYEATVDAVRMEMAR
jgi:hypothetical protein